MLCTVKILLPLQEEADTWLIRCDTLPPLWMHWQPPTLWLIKNQTDLFSFSSGKQRGSEQEDISINVSLNLLSHWRVFGGLTFLISPLFCYKFKYLHMCVDVSTPRKAHVTLHILPLKSKCIASVLTTACCHIVSMYLPRGLQEVHCLSLTEMHFHIILPLITYLCTFTPATLTSHNYALMFSTHFAKTSTCPFMYFHSQLMSGIYFKSFYTS